MRLLICMCKSIKSCPPIFDEAVFEPLLMIPWEDVAAPTHSLVGVWRGQITDAERFSLAMFSRVWKCRLVNLDP